MRIRHVTTTIIPSTHRLAHLHLQSERVIKRLIAHPSGFENIGNILVISPTTIQSVYHTLNFVAIGRKKLRLNSTAVRAESYIWQ
jgi:hypothetical protein